MVKEPRHQMRIAKPGERKTIEEKPYEENPVDWRSKEVAVKDGIAGEGGVPRAVAGKMGHIDQEALFVNEHRHVPAIKQSHEDKEQRHGDQGESSEPPGRRTPAAVFRPVAMWTDRQEERPLPLSPHRRV